MSCKIQTHKAPTAIGPYSRAMAVYAQYFTENPARSCEAEKE